MTAEGIGEVVNVWAAQYADLVEIVYQGLTRAHPKLAREEFLDMAATDLELFLAFLVIRDQSGLFVAKPAGVEAGNPGEAHPQRSPIGTD